MKYSSLFYSVILGLSLTACEFAGLNSSDEGDGDSSSNDNTTLDTRADDSTRHDDHYDDYDRYDDYQDPHHTGSQLSPHCEQVWEESMEVVIFQRFFDECSHEARDAIDSDPMFTEECRIKGKTALDNRDDGLMYEFSEKCLPNDRHNDPYDQGYDDHYDDHYDDGQHHNGPYLSAHCEDIAYKAETNPSDENVQYFLDECFHEVLNDSEFPVWDERISDSCRGTVEYAHEQSVRQHFQADYSGYNCTTASCDPMENLEQEMKETCSDEDFRVMDEYHGYYQP